MVIYNIFEFFWEKRFFQEKKAGDLYFQMSLRVGYRSRYLLNSFWKKSAYFVNVELDTFLSANDRWGLNNCPEIMGPTQKCFN